ncbi:hypothetical protein [Pseudomonas sp. FEN]|uniref:hypothetical protein n=1 Tax=Pseudomonas sp. FEN TaxID=2767468 RepID=UPI00174CF447|nr:hypothetical protein [Pseudomonas sp. FEN]
MRAVVVLLVLIFLSGCQLAKIVTTSKIHPDVDEIKQQDGILAITEINNTRISGLPETVTNLCESGQPKAFAAAIWVPIAAKVVVDVVTGAVTDYVKRIKSESSRSVTFKTVVMSGSLIEANCIALVRGDEKNPSAVVVLKVEVFGEKGFTLQPIFARLNRTVSLTKCTANCGDKTKSEGQVNMVVAVSGSAADGTLKDLGTGATTIRGLSIRAQTVNVTQGVGAPTSLIALPAANIPVQLSVSMADMGNVAGDPDIALGEVQAAMAALKEGAVAEVSAHYKD